MTKAQLTDLVLDYARAGRAQMIEDHGSLRPHSLIVGLDGKHNMVITDVEMHGYKMAIFLVLMAAKFGGADAILVQSDARFRRSTPEEWAARKPSDRDIQDNVNNPECLLTAARSQEHQAIAFCTYTRTPSPDGDVIVFDTPEPVLNEDFQQGEIFMLPNLWKKVN